MEKSQESSFLRQKWLNLYDNKELADKVNPNYNLNMGRESLVGRQYGYLTVIEKISNKEERPKGYEHYNFWICRCECGNKITLPTGKLYSKLVSCGCRKEEGRMKMGRSTVSPQEASIRALFNSYKANAKLYGREFLLSLEDFKDLIFDHCYYCGESPFTSFNIYEKKGKNKYSKLRVNGGSIKYNGIDRKNNDGDYEIYNCVTCCKICNYAKRNYKYEDFINWLEKIASRWSN